MPCASLRPKRGGGAHLPGERDRGGGGGGRKSKAFLCRPPRPSGLPFLLAEEGL